MAHISTSSIPSFPISEGTVILLDVDDTLITPVSAFFHHDPYKKTLDNLKTEQHPDLQDILGHWRLQRHIQILDDQWPATLMSWKEQGATVLALTQMHSGEYGPIPSMERWRFEELSSLGISFSQPITTPEPITLLSSERGNATYYNGILITGPFSKAETFSAFMKRASLPLSKIVFFDDRPSHLDALELWSREKSLDFMGFHFTGLDRMNTRLDSDLAEWQKEQLLKHYQWFEDHEARLKMEKE